MASGRGRWEMRSTAVVFLAAGLVVLVQVVTVDVEVDVVVAVEVVADAVEYLSKYYLASSEIIIARRASCEVALLQIITILGA